MRKPWRGYSPRSANEVKSCCSAWKHTSSAKPRYCKNRNWRAFSFWSMGRSLPYFLTRACTACNSQSASNTTCGERSVWAGFGLGSISLINKSLKKSSCCSIHASISRADFNVVKPRFFTIMPDSLMTVTFTDSLFNHRWGHAFIALITFWGKF